MREFLIDLFSTLVFVCVFFAIGDIFLATGVAILAGIGQIAFFKLRGRYVHPMQWMSLALVVVFGGATLYLHDPRFIMVKPSIIHFAIGSVMLKRGWMERYLPEIAKENLSNGLVDGWGYAWAALMFGLGIVNIVIALSFSPEIWGWFLSFGAIGAKLLMFATQYVTMRMTVIQNLRRAAAAPAAD